MYARTLSWHVIALVGLLVAACTPPPGGGRERVGELGAAGTNVSVNGRLAVSGTTIYSGDTVTTGPGSSAMILLATGGIFQIDENTDPLFSWETIANMRCILVRLLRGQSYVEDTQACISSPAADALAHSAVNVLASSSLSVMTLLRGTLVLQRPQQVTLVPGQEVTANTNAPTVQVRNLSQAELMARVAWRGRYRFQGWCSVSGGARPAWLGECPGQFSFSRPPAPPSAVSPPFVPLPTYIPPRPRTTPGRPSPG